MAARERRDGKGRRAGGRAGRGRTVRCPYVSFTAGPTSLTKAMREVDLPLPGAPQKMLGLRVSRRLWKIVAMSLSSANFSICVRRWTKSFAVYSCTLYSMAQGTWNHALWPMQQMGTPSWNFSLHEGRLQVVRRLALMMLKYGWGTAKGGERGGES